jgi:hypothetical protein
MAFVSNKSKKKLKTIWDWEKLRKQKRDCSEIALTTIAYFSGSQPFCAHAPPKRDIKIGVPPTDF